MQSSFSRRGQSASGAAILVAIIGGLLIGYILFLPPAEREQLLFGDGSGSAYPGSTAGPGALTQYGPVLILTTSPGTLRLQKSPVAEHTVPSATIFTAINTEPIKSVDSAIIKNGAFAKKDLEMTFDVQKGSSTNYLLSFNVDEAGDAPLRILLNGKQLYERPIRERSPAPIPLPVDYLVDGENTVTIESGDVGLAFWRPNTYLVTNVLISADLINTAGAVSEQSFSLTEAELANYENAQLQFVPECDQRKAGRLVVQLNSDVARMPNNQTYEVPNILYNGLVDCGVLFKTDVAKEHLRSGENSVLFASQGGQYVIDRIKLIVHMRQTDYPVYYFNLPKDMYDTLDLGRGQLRLTLTFTDYRNVKSGELVINGFVQSFTTQDYAWQAVIDPAILTPGPNTIQIIPHVDKLDVAELKIELV